MKNKNKLFFCFAICILLITMFSSILYSTIRRRRKEGFVINSSISPTSKNKYVCIYAYYEKNNDYKKNLEYFLKNGGIKPDIDYYIVINGTCTVNIPTLSNIQVIQRENKGYDFGAWQHVIKNYIKKPYDYYIFLNSSVIGPYPKNEPWLPRFLELFSTGPDVKLVGTSIAVLNNNEDCFLKSYLDDYKNLNVLPHVQSMFFILNQEGFQYLSDIGFFDDEDKLNKENQIWYVIANKEIKLSNNILKNGWNINSILPKYRDIDYRTITHNINPTGEDPYYPKRYFGETIQPEDVIFYKSYRLQ